MHMVQVANDEVRNATLPWWQSRFPTPCAQASTSRVADMEFITTTPLDSGRGRARDHTVVGRARRWIRPDTSGSQCVRARTKAGAFGRDRVPFALWARRSGPFGYTPAP